MSKVVRVLQNQDDFNAFCEFVYNNDCKIYSYEAKAFSVEELKNFKSLECFRILENGSTIQIEKIGNRYLFSETTEYLEFDNCNVKNGIAEWGSIIYRHGETALQIFK